MPGWVNVCDALCPFFRIPVLKLPLLAVAVCSLGPSLVHVIVSPVWIVTVAGVNLKSEIVSPGSAARWAASAPRDRSSPAARERAEVGLDASVMPVRVSPARRWRRALLGVA